MTPVEKHTKTPIIAGIVLVCALVFPGCSSAPDVAARKDSARAVVQTARQNYADPIQPIQITDYKTRTEGEELPEWVNHYLAEGVRGVEKIPEFQNKYVFVGLSEGTNFKALSQWEAAFSPAQDLARLVASRIEARLTAAAHTSIPDDTYGPFFETLIKNASDAQYQGAVKESGFWIRQAPPAEESGRESEGGAERGVTEINREVYNFLVLVSIDKNQLESQINTIFDAADANLKHKRDEAAAINRIRDNLFEGF